ncbi:MAG: alpha/beta hydrolase [Verrucomicrobiales bacterium]|nr:alpha/beta hydrolase [Verrucomicrobiales bacterium]
MARIAQILLKLNLFGILLFCVTSCSVPVKVRENWKTTGPSEVPLNRAASVWNEISSGTMPDEERLELYNDAVRQSVVQVARNQVSPGRSLSLLQTTDGGVNLTVESINVPGMKLIEEVVPADFIRVKRGFESKTEIKGVGAALMVRKAWSESDPMIPKSGIWYPVTGVLNLDVPAAPVLKLYDPTDGSTILKSGTEFPLSVDYTATFARDFQERQFQFSTIPAMFRFEKFADRMGLYRVSALNEEKEVCILVHGIKSSPNTWHEALNKTFADEEIRERYEFWTFGYPSGAPIPYLATKLRDSMHEMLAFRQRRGAVNQKVTVVGHSMGGILAKAVTQEGGDSDWDKLFKVPIDALRVNSEDREILRNMVYYEPIGEVHRVIFCAVPHRGSKFAAKPGAKIVGDLIQVPKQIAQLTTDIVKQSGYALTPLGMEIAKHRVTSLDQLRPTSQVTVEYLYKPLNPSVEFYSVIGRKDSDPAKPPEETTDGVVAYSSSHISGVVSEKFIFDSPHGVHQTDQGIQEIIRILRLP